MTLKQIAALGRKLTLFLALFADCFGRRRARDLLRIYVNGQLSNLHRKTAEAIALQFRTAPRTLQRFLESIKWDEEKLRDRCQQIVAKDHAHPDAIGCLDAADLPPSARRQRYEDELEKQEYHQRRNKQARASHRKTRIGSYIALGIAINQIKSCLPDT